MTTRLTCLLGALLLCLACSKSCDNSDDSYEPTYFHVAGAGPIEVKHPTPLEAMEAKCTWPCDAHGCIKAPDREVCQVRCETDADCPAESICVCEADGCSWGRGNIISGPLIAENSCHPLLPGMAEAIEQCRREKNCSKHPGRR